MVEGHIRLFRKFKKSSFYKDSIYVHVWVHLLLSANWSEKRIKLDGSDQFIDIKPGQFLTSRTKLSAELGINRSKLERILNALKSEQQIEQQTFSKYRVISICNWSEYQQSEQQNEPQMSSKRAASEQQVSTNNNKKNKKNKEEESLKDIVEKTREARFVPPLIEEVKAYCEERGNTINAQHWYDHYSSNGWKVGSNKMKDWQAAVRTWEQKQKGYSNGQSRTSGGSAQTGKKTGIVEANGAGTDFLS